MRIVLISVSLLLLSGCGMVNKATAPWMDHPVDCPWDSKGGKARLESREYWPSVMAAGKSVDMRFVTSSNSSLDADRLIKRSIDFIENKGYLDVWQKSNSYYYRLPRPQIIPPYRFYLCSVNPAVYVLIPHNHGPGDGRSNYDILGGDLPNYTYFMDPRLLTYIRMATHVPESGEFYWFSPDLGVDITKAEKYPEGFRITHSKVVLEGKRETAGFKIIRQK